MKVAIYLTTFCLVKLSVEQRYSKWRFKKNSSHENIFAETDHTAIKKNTKNIFSFVEITLYILPIKKVFFFPQQGSMRCREETQNATNFTCTDWKHTDT